MIYKYDVYKPNNRALTAKEGTTLSLGLKYPELRWLFYLAHDNNPYKGYSERKVYKNTFFFILYFIQIKYTGDHSIPSWSY